MNIGNLSIFGLTCALFTSLIPAATAIENRPNIILILAPDLGWSDTTLYDTTQLYQTPNLERLAQRGMLFTRAYAASPVAAPTAASLLTGISPARLGYTADGGDTSNFALKASVEKTAPNSAKVLACLSATRLDFQHTILPESLKKAGYTTGHFGRWPLGAEAYSPEQQGFDTDIPSHSTAIPLKSQLAPWGFPDLPEQTSSEHISDRITDEAIQWLEQHQGSPFFLNLWHYPLTSPYAVKPNILQKYTPLVSTRNDQRNPTYAAAIETLDTNIGKLLNAIDRLGLSEKTAIIFTSSNGGIIHENINNIPITSNSPLRGGKYSLYEGGVSIPCIISWPKLTTPESRSEAIIQTTDLYPTILDILNLKPEKDQPLDGISILPALHRKPLSRNAIFTYYPHRPNSPLSHPPAVSVISNQWKLIRLFHQAPETAHLYQLFHLSEDIAEEHNLAAAHPERVLELDALITTYLQSTSASTPQPNLDYDPAATATPFPAAPENRTSLASKSPPPPQQPQLSSPPIGHKVPPGFDPQLQGWISRSSTSQTLKNDSLLLTHEPPIDFFIASPNACPPTSSTINARIRCTSGGKGKIQWQHKSPNDFTTSTDFTLLPGKWTEIQRTSPAGHYSGLVRIYFPNQSPSAEIDWIEVRSPNTPLTRWEF